MSSVGRVCQVCQCVECVQLCSWSEPQSLKVFKMSGRPRTTSFADKPSLNPTFGKTSSASRPSSSLTCSLCLAGKDGSKITTVVATPGQGPDRAQEVAYTDAKVIGNGSFGVVYQAKLCETGELVAIKKVLQDKRFKVISFHSIHVFS